MGIFGSPERRSATISDELFAQRRGGSASVSPDKALQLAAVWACYRILAGVGSTLPIDQFRGSEPVSTEALFAEPVAGQPVSDWLHRLWISVLSTGNAYAYVSHDSSAQRVVSAELLPSSLIRWEQRNKQ